jgi:hypothetical protein
MNLSAHDRQTAETNSGSLWCGFVEFESSEPDG